MHLHLLAGVILVTVISDIASGLTCYSCLDVQDINECVLTADVEHTMIPRPRPKRHDRRGREKQPPSDHDDNQGDEDRDDNQGDVDVVTRNLKDDLQCYTEISIRDGQVSYTLGAKRKGECHVEAARHHKLWNGGVKQRGGVKKCKQCCSEDSCNKESCFEDIEVPKLNPTSRFELTNKPWVTNEAAQKIFQLFPKFFGSYNPKQQESTPGEQNIAGVVLSPNSAKITDLHSGSRLKPPSSVSIHIPGSHNDVGDKEATKTQHSSWFLSFLTNSKGSSQTNGDPIKDVNMPQVSTVTTKPNPVAPKQNQQHSSSVSMNMIYIPESHYDAVDKATKTQHSSWFLSFLTNSKGSSQTNENSIKDENRPQTSAVTTKQYTVAHKQNQQHSSAYKAPQSSASSPSVTASLTITEALQSGSSLMDFSSVGGTTVSAPSVTKDQQDTTSSPSVAKDQQDTTSSPSVAKDQQDTTSSPSVTDVNSSVDIPHAEQSVADITTHSGSATINLRTTPIEYQVTVTSEKSVTSNLTEIYEPTTHASDTEVSTELGTSEPMPFVSEVSTEPDAATSGPSDAPDNVICTHLVENIGCQSVWVRADCPLSCKMHRHEFIIV